MSRKDPPKLGNSSNKGKVPWLESGGKDAKVGILVVAEAEQELSDSGYAPTPVVVGSKDFC